MYVSLKIYIFTPGFSSCAGAREFHTSSCKRPVSMQQQQVSPTGRQPMPVNIVTDLMMRWQVMPSSLQSMPARAMSKLKVPSLKPCRTLCCCVGVPAGSAAGRQASPSR